MKKSTRKSIEKKYLRIKKAEGDNNKSEHSKLRSNKRPNKNNNRPKE